ncbi:MAG: LacI family DNA-binding transcriptional regulator [Caldilineaceae bacterium]
MSFDTPRSHAKVTIADIARKSGVSAATVSLALRNKAGLRNETRQRVLDTAQQLGYLYQSSNQAATRLEVNHIGVIIKARANDPAATNSFYGPVLTGIEEICRRRQIHLVYANLLVDEKNVPIEPPRLLTERHTDGLLIVGLQVNTALQTILQQDNSPVVLVDAYAADNPFDAVVSDNFTGGYMATRHLLAQGHTKIAIVGSQPHAFPSIVERRNGYCKALAEAGLTPYFWDCPLWPEAAAEAARTYLVQQPEVTAIFACNDALAIAVMQVLRERNCVPPDDLSIIGFDNIELAQHTTPPLTTMRVDKTGMGRLAAQLLINRIEYPAAALVQTTIRPELICRQSVAVHNAVTNRAPILR